MKDKMDMKHFFQFDTYCRKVIKFNGCSMMRNEQRKEEKTVDCIAFDEALLGMVYVEDKYRVLFPQIILPNLSVYIEDEELHYQLCRLSRRRLEILILSYFLELSDFEIGQRMKIAKSTVQHNRKKALVFLRNNMKL